MLSHCFCLFYRIVTGNNTNNKSESDQEDNDDVNDNDWSYGAEKKGDALELLDLPQILTHYRFPFFFPYLFFSFAAKKRKSDKVLFIYPSIDIFINCFMYKSIKDFSTDFLA